MELHVFIEVTAPIPEAYLRMAHAMEEVKKFLIPVCVWGNLSHPKLEQLSSLSFVRYALNLGYSTVMLCVFNCCPVYRNLVSMIHTWIHCS